jgi:hypothetical protein
VGFDDCSDAQAPEIDELTSRIRHQEEIIGFGTVVIHPYQVSTSGQWLEDAQDFSAPFATGTTYQFGPVTTGTDGRYTIQFARAPAFWRIYVHSGPCAGQFNGFGLHHQVETQTICYVIGGPSLNPVTNADPEVIDASSPPSTVTIFGTGLTSVGGMPNVEYYAEDGHLAQQSQATACAVDGTWISGPPPNLSFCHTGHYTLIVRNSDGVAVAAAEITVLNDPGCNPDPEQVSNCEMALGHFWDYDTCRCVDHNP